MKNPRAKFLSVLQMSQVDYAARKNELIAYLDAHPELQDVKETDARNALTVPVTPEIWNRLKADLGCD